MESLPPPPLAGDGVLFVLSGPQMEHAQRKHVAGLPMQRLGIVRSMTAGQPIFLFDADARVLRGPYSAAGPGGTHLDAGNSKLPAQVKFTPAVRSFAPLPEDAVSDMLNYEPGMDETGRRRPAPQVEASAVPQLLLLFVLHHHGLLNDDEGSERERLREPSSRSVATRLATFLQMRGGRAILGTSLGEFYSTLESPAAGDACREVMRTAFIPGCKKGLQSFVHQHRDLLRLVGEKLSLSVGLAADVAMGAAQ